MNKVILQKTRITNEQIMEAFAYSLFKLQKCKKCGLYAHQDEIKFLHPLICSIDGDRFMCTTCYDENIIPKILCKSLNSNTSNTINYSST